MTGNRVAGRIGDFLASRRLALVLLLLLASLSVTGTFLPPKEAERFFAETFGPSAASIAIGIGLADIYRSVPYTSMLVLLCLNIAFCTWRRFRRRAGGPEGGNVAARWLDVTLHLAVLILLAGGLGKSLLGFTGTEYLFVDVETATVFDWEVEKDVPLGFTVLMKERVEEYYPLQLRIGIRDRASGANITLLEALEGKKVRLPGGDLEIGVRRFDAERGEVLLVAEGAGEKRDLALAVQAGEGSSAPFGPYELVLVAYRRDLKRVRGLLAIIDGGEVQKEEWLAPNSRVAYKGTSIFPTAWGVDEFGNAFIGVQVSRDPAAPLFWCGAVLLATAMPLFFYWRHRSRRPSERGGAG